MEKQVRVRINNAVKPVQLRIKSPLKPDSQSDFRIESILKADSPPVKTAAVITMIVGRRPLTYCFTQWAEGGALRLMRGE